MPMSQHHVDVSVTLNLSTAVDQARLGVDASSMVEDETGWLQNFSPSPSYDGSGGSNGSSADDVLLTGHLDLVRALVTCHGVSRLAVGRWRAGSSWGLRLRLGLGRRDRVSHFERLEKCC